MRFASLSVVFLALANIASAGEFDGLYRDSSLGAARCDLSLLGSDGGPMRITGQTFEYVESTCKLADPVKVRGMNATLFDLECSGEGETYSYRIMLMKAGAGLIAVQDGSVSQFARCN